jgi:GDP-4-dehydro-6-deoxy-D-mannose reductase
MPSPRVFITGIAGFAGSHLAELCLASGDRVGGTVLPGTPVTNRRGVPGSVELIYADLLKPKSVASALRRARATWIIHLVASTSVGDSFQAPGETIRNNIISTLNLLETIRLDKTVRRSIEKIIMVASSEVYGRVRPAMIPLSEKTPLAPVNPYGASKASADLIAFSYGESFGLPIVRVRASNHAGPRQRTGFVVPDFCDAISRLEKKKAGRVMKVGNLSARRDFSDVRDIVRGYRQIAQKGHIGGVYHLGSGRARSVRAVLNSLLRMARQPIEVITDPQKLRPVEVPILLADTSRARREVGYEPTIPWAQTLADTLEYHRQRV